MVSPTSYISAEISCLLAVQSCLPPSLMRQRTLHYSLQCIPQSQSPSLVPGYSPEWVRFIATRSISGPDKSSHRYLADLPVIRELRRLQTKGCWQQNSQKPQRPSWRFQGHPHRLPRSRQPGWKPRCSSCEDGHSSYYTIILITQLATIVQSLDAGEQRVANCSDYKGREQTHRHV